MKKKKSIYPRHLARSVAKANMKKAGMRRVNSIFAWYWRDFVKMG